MPHQESKKLVLLLSHNSNSDKSTVAFTIANAALSGGTEVAIFLTSDGVELSREGSCDLTTVRPFKPINELIDSFVEAGGVLWSCSPCFQHRGLDPKETVEGAVVTGATSLLEWIAAGASTLSL